MVSAHELKAIVLLLSISHSVIAMDSDLTYPGSCRKQEPGSFYIETDLHKKQFYVMKPFRPSPHTLHMHGCPCTGHEEHSLYEKCNDSMSQLHEHIESAKVQNKHKLALQLMGCSRLLEAYGDATCSHMSVGASSLEQRLAAWEMIVKTFPKMDAALCETWHGGEVFDQAVVALKDFLYKKVSKAESGQAFKYFISKAHQGAPEALCYCILDALIVKRSSVDAFSLFRQLVSSEQGRHVLPLLVRLCDVGMAPSLSKQKDKNVGAILGVMAYICKDYVKAFQLISTCADANQCPYLYYLLACLCKNGHGESVGLDRTAGYLVRAAAGADIALLHDIESELINLADNGNAAAGCELLLLLARDPKRIIDMQSRASLLMQRGQGRLVYDYMEKKKLVNRLEKMAQDNNPAALYMMALYHELRSHTLVEPRLLIEEIKEKVACLERIPSHVLNVEKEIGLLAQELVAMYCGQGDYDKALVWLQRAKDCGIEGAGQREPLVRLFSSSGTEKDVEASVAELLRTIGIAHEYEDAFLRRVIRMFFYGCDQLKSGVKFPKYPQHAYRLTLAFLERVPHDTMCLYFLGKLLYEYGGKGDIPADNERALACLTQAMGQGQELEPSDLINMALTHCKKGEYKEALACAEKASEDPLGEMYEGIFCLLLPHSPVLEERALGCFNAALCHVSSHSPDLRVLELMKGENGFINYIKNKKEQGDKCFALVLLRFAAIYGLEAVGMEACDAELLLIDIAASDVPSVRSFCAHLYHEKCPWWGSSDEKAFQLSLDVLKNKESSIHAIDEATCVLNDLAKNENGKLSIKSCYELSRYFVHDPDVQESVVARFAIAEIRLANFQGDAELFDYARSIGLWDIMRAKAKGDMQVASVLSQAYSLRLRMYPQGQWVEEIERYGMPCLEKMIGVLPGVDNAAISRDYVSLFDALRDNGAASERCAAALKRACEFDAKSQGVCARMALWESDPSGKLTVVREYGPDNDMAHAFSEFTEGKKAQDVKKKEHHYQEMMRRMLEVLKYVAIIKEHFGLPSIDRAFNDLLMEIDKQAETDSYLKKILMIINRDLESKGFVRRHV